MITPWHRYVFYAITAQLRSSVELLKGFNETLDGCVIVPGYAEKALETAGEIEKLAQNITGCSYIKMITLIKSFQSYVERMSPFWERLSMNCAERKHDTKQVKELLNWLSKKTNETVELAKILSRSVSSLQGELDRYGGGLEELQKQLEELVKSVNASSTRLIGEADSMADRFKSLEGELGRLQEQLDRLGQRLNVTLNVTLPGERG